MIPLHLHVEPDPAECVLPHGGDDHLRLCRRGGNRVTPALRHSGTTSHSLSQFTRKHQRRQQTYREIS